MRKNPRSSVDKLVVGRKVTNAQVEKVANINLDVTKEAVELQSSIKSGLWRQWRGTVYAGIVSTSPNRITNRTVAC